jgi:hypothetical protein
MKEFQSWSLGQVNWFLSADVVSPGEPRGTLAPNTRQRPAVQRGDMRGVKEEVHHCWSAAENRGTLAPNTGRLPAVPRSDMHRAEEDFRTC